MLREINEVWQESYPVFYHRQSSYFKGLEPHGWLVPHKNAKSKDIRYFNNGKDKEESIFNELELKRFVADNKQNIKRTRKFKTTNAKIVVYDNYNCS